MLALAFTVIVNAGLLTMTAEASASGYLDGIRGFLILLAFTAEALLLYWNQHLFRRGPK